MQGPQGFLAKVAMKWGIKRFQNRFHYLIDKKFQLRLVFIVLLSLIAFAVFIGWQVYYSIWPIIVSEIPTFRLEIIRVDFLFRLLHFTAPTLLVIAVMVVFFSHRIVGPIYHVERTLEDLIDGKDVKELRLRKKDQFQSLAPKINAVIRLVKKLRKRSL